MSQLSLADVPWTRDALWPSPNRVGHYEENYVEMWKVWPLFWSNFTLPQRHNITSSLGFPPSLLAPGLACSHFPWVRVGCKHAQRFLAPITSPSKPCSVLNLSFQSLYPDNSLMSKADLSQTGSLLPDLGYQLHHPSYWSTGVSEAILTICFTISYSPLGIHHSFSSQLPQPCTIISRQDHMGAPQEFLKNLFPTLKHSPQCCQSNFF